MEAEVACSNHAGRILACRVLARKAPRNAETVRAATPPERLTLERNLRRERITVDEIAAHARSQQIESLGDVKWAVLETSGQITFIKKAEDGS